MGLDITAYERISLVRAMPVKVYNNDEEAQALAEQDDHRYLLNVPSGLPQADGLPDGIYQTSGRRMGFWAGSYGGYNMWRNWLSLLMLDMSAERVWRLTDAQRDGRPFVELINFSDCEGFIGPQTSAKLAKDFAMYKWKMRDADPSDVARYNHWQEAFAIAAGNGAVDFH